MNLKSILILGLLVATSASGEILDVPSELAKMAATRREQKRIEHTAAPRLTMKIFGSSRQFVSQADRGYFAQELHSEMNNKAVKICNLIRAQKVDISNLVFKDKIVESNDEPKFYLNAMADISC